MKIHHLGCTTFCIYPRRLIEGHGLLTEKAKIVCHCLLVESKAGLVLVDTGLGLQDIRAPRERLGALAGSALGHDGPSEESTARRQIEALGFKANDVRHIVLTHLDLDHAGGLPDFPDATVHVSVDEHEAATQPRLLIEQHRYRSVQWAHRPKWHLYQPIGDKFFGFDAVRTVIAKQPDILLIPLQGHTRGHCGVAVQSGKHWLLHAGDAYFHRNEMLPENPSCPVGLRLFQRLIDVDHHARVQNQQRLRELIREHSPDVRVFSAHDWVEWANLASETTPSKTQR